VRSKRKVQAVQDVEGTRFKQGACGEEKIRELFTAEARGTERKNFAIRISEFEFSNYELGVSVIM
jgi:hypothetical protein